jgi:hypothetical protein
MGRDPSLVTGRPWSPGRMDEAETFAESDVTLTHTKTTVAGEGVELSDSSGSSFTKSNLGTSSGGGDPDVGVIINPNRDVSAVTFTMATSGNISGGTVYVEDTSGNVLASQSSVGSGDSGNISVALSGGTDYRLYYNDGDDDHGGVDTGPSYPYTTTDVDIVDGYHTGGRIDRWYSFKEVGVEYIATTGTVTVEWPAPDDLAGWDIVPFQTAPDGETVEVYAEDQNGNKLAGPLEDPGDISSVSRSTNVRIRVDLSRSDTANNPRLEAVYRRYKV